MNSHCTHLTSNFRPHYSFFVHLCLIELFNDVKCCLSVNTAVELVATFKYTDSSYRKSYTTLSVDCKEKRERKIMQSNCIT